MTRLILPVPCKPLASFHYDQDRSLALDAAKFVAAAAIVWLHTLAINPAWSRLADLGRFAVPFFVLTAVVMIGETLRRTHRIAYRQFLTKRFWRLYVPFLAWSAIYLLLRDLKCMADGRPPVPVGPHLLFVGSTHHLWFLPFLFLVSAVFFPVLVAVVRNRSSGAAIAGLTAVAAIVVATTPSPWTFSPESTGFLDRMAYLGVLAWNATPAALLGVSCTFVYPALRRTVHRHAWIAIVALMMMMGLGLMELLARGRSIPVETSLGGVFLVSALGPRRGRLVSLLAYLGQYAYGIYLTHVAFVLGLEAVLKQNRSNITVWQLGMIFGLALLLSLLASLGMKRWKATRWLVP